MNIISLVNLKGGVGKTTSCLNIGAALGRLGEKVLLIDLDPQGNLSEYLGWVPDGVSTISELLYNEVAGISSDPATAIRKGLEVDYLPSTKMLSAIVAVLGNDPNSQEVLKRLLEHDAFAKYSYILIDCKPSLDLLVCNALTASTGVIVPVQAELFAYNAVHEVLETVTKIQNTVNAALLPLGILLTFFRKQTSVSQEVLAALKETYPELLLPIPISFSTEAGKSVCMSRSLVTTPGSKLGQEYMQIAEIIQQGGN